MPTAAIDVYVAAFVARATGGRELDAAGVVGQLSSADAPRTRLLVTDDRAHDVLAALLPSTRTGTITVFATATRCARLVGRDPAWTAKAVTAMTSRDLAAVPAVPLPGELTLQPVRRLAGDTPAGVPIEDAITLARLADPAIAEPPDAFADSLRSLPPAIRLLAAVDGDGAVRATSGYGAFGTQASVFFVNTDPEWRRRGIATAMTSAALRAAHGSGARQASLDASAAGLPIYRRFGFETVAPATQFFRGG